MIVQKLEYMKQTVKSVKRIIGQTRRNITTKFKENFSHLKCRLDVLSDNGQWTIYNKTINLFTKNKKNLL